MVKKYLTQISLRLFAFVALLSACSKEHQPLQEKQANNSASTSFNISELLSVPQRDPKVSLQQAIGAGVNNGDETLRATQSKKVLSHFTLYTRAGEPALYVVNYAPEGYAIVSASRKYTPIISQSSKGSVSLESAFMNELLQSYVKEIERANSLPDSLTKLARLQWEFLGERGCDDFRTVDYDETAYKKISEAIHQYIGKGYRVYRYKELLGHYTIPKRFVPNESDSYDSEPALPESKEDYFLTPEIKKEIIDAVTLYATKHYNVDSHVLILLKENNKINRVNNLLRTEWGQGSCPSKKSIDYNMFIPQKYLVGCVALAVGQIMRYHRYPEHFDWDAMPNHEATPTTAQFLYDVAEGVKTDYGCGKYDSESTATSENTKSYLNFLGYRITHIFDNNRDKDSIVREELKASRPIFVGGNFSMDLLPGHAFVLDGYDKSKYQYEVQVLSFPDAPLSYLKDENLECIYSKEVFKGSTDSYHLNLGWGGKANSGYSFRNFLGFNINRQYIFITPPQR